MLTAFARSPDTGQVCVASSRIFVQKGIYPHFLKALKTSLEQIRSMIGDPVQAGTIMGPLVDRTAGEMVARYLELGKREGQVLCGGARIEGQVGLSATILPRPSRS